MGSVDLCPYHMNALTKAGLYQIFSQLYYFLRFAYIHDNLLYYIEFLMALQANPEWPLLGNFTVEVT